MQAFVQKQYFLTRLSGSQVSLTAGVALSSSPAYRNSSSVVVTIFSISELDFDSSIGIRLISSFWSTKSLATWFSAMRERAAGVSFFRIASDSVSCRGGSNGTLNGWSLTARSVNHTIRRATPSLIYKRTKNLRAGQLLLGHQKLESTVRYLGIEASTWAY